MDRRFKLEIATSIRESTAAERSAMEFVARPAPSFSAASAGRAGDGHPLRARLAASRRAHGPIFRRLGARTGPVGPRLSRELDQPSSRSGPPVRSACAVAPAVRVHPDAEHPGRSAAGDVGREAVADHRRLGRPAPEPLERHLEDRARGACRPPPGGRRRRPRRPRASAPQPGSHSPGATGSRGSRFTVKNAAPAATAREAARKPAKSNAGSLPTATAVARRHSSKAPPCVRRAPGPRASARSPAAAPGPAPTRAGSSRRAGRARPGRRRARVGIPSRVRRVGDLAGAARGSCW